VKPSNVVSITFRAIVPSALILLLSAPSGAFAQTAAQDHLVSPQTLQHQLSDSATTRQKNIETVNNFLSSPIADQAIRDAHYNPEQVRNAVPTLSDQELASLSTRAQDVQQKFAAGALTKTEIGLIAIAFVVLIIVIIVH
jgi:hypothetical protein